jgi:hypothetical protein
MSDNKNKKAQEVVSDNLINVTISSNKEHRTLTTPSADDYKVVLEDDGYYKITLNGETVIHTMVSAKLLHDLKMMNIIPEKETPENEKKALEAYLIKAAKKFVIEGLHKKKQQANGKIDVAGIEDEF